MSILNREIEKILKQVDKIAKGGREKYLDYYSLIDEMIRKSKWDIFKRALYSGYYIDIENFPINDSKSYSWKEILKLTNKSLDEQKFKLFKSKDVWTQALNYYLESNSFKLGEIRETIIYQDEGYAKYTQQIFDKYKVTTQNKFLQDQRIKLDVRVNHVLPYFVPSIVNVDWEEVNISWELLNVNWSETPSLTQSYSTLPLYSNVSGFVIVGDQRDRIQSGLKLLGVTKTDSDRIIKRPNKSIDFILTDGKYKSILDQKLKIDFNLTVVPIGGTGSIHLCLYDLVKKTPKFIPFLVDGDIYSNYTYSDGEEITISGSKTIDIKSGDILGLGLYNQSESSIDGISFTISDCSVSFICQEIKDTPQFLTKADIDWIRLNNSIRIGLIGEVPTFLPKLSVENITFSDWDDDISRDKNVINLYTQAIDYLIQNYEDLTPN